MFPLHCNKCFCTRKLEPKRLFNISRCGHIICQQCLQSKCRICSKSYNAIPIQKEMPASMLEYFDDPIKSYRHYQKVAKFHYDQERSLGIHLYRTNEAAIQKVTAELQAFNKLHVKLTQTKEKERERIRKLKEYIAYFERRLEQSRYVKPPVAAQPRYRYPSRHKNTQDSSGVMPVVDCMPQLTQTARSHYAPPRSPTLSNNNSSGSEKTLSEASRRMLRTPPPLLPFSEYKKKSKKSPNRKHFKM